MNEVGWNPWHGCHKISAGCLHCYVYRIDAQHDKAGDEISLNKNFELPVRRLRDGSYKIPPNSFIYTCFSSDFFLEEADLWRKRAWDMMRERSDCTFFFVTKRIHRFYASLPEDWGNGWENIHICCTCENQTCADKRLPIFKELPIRHKSIICEPLLAPIDLSQYLDATIEQVLVGGESGEGARICDYDWVLGIREQCMQAQVPFRFKQTGANFRKDGRLYKLTRAQQLSQAAKAGIQYMDKNS